MVTIIFDAITIVVNMSKRRKRGTESPENQGLPETRRRRRNNQTNTCLSQVKTNDPESGDSKIGGSVQSDKACIQSKIDSKSSYTFFTLMVP